MVPSRADLERSRVPARRASRIGLLALAATATLLLNAWLLAGPAAADTYYLRTSGGPALLPGAPMAATPAFKDSPAINRTVFQEIGTWLAAPAATAVHLAALADLRVWLGLKNSDDQGTYFDVRADLLKGGVVIASGEVKGIQGVTRNPDKAKEVAVPLGPISDGQIAAGDVLALRLLAKVADSGGHGNAVGLRLYYDGVSRPSRFGATLAAAGPQIAFTAPAPGATVPAGALLVRGTVSAPAQAGVSVNGFAAMVHGGEWAVELPVDSSVQLLTATASVVGGESATASVPITVDPGEPGAVELHVDPADGVAPLVVTWKVVNNTGRTLIQYELDSTGGGTFEPVASLDTPVTYSVPGLWFPTLRVTDDQGVTYTSAAAIVASDPATVSVRFDALWTGLKARLQAGDVAGALQFLAPALQPRMERVFQDLGPALPTLASSLGDLHVTDQLGNLAEAVLVQDEPGGPQVYFIQFRRDTLGRWLIEEM
jgi:hypothetical protein